MAQRHLRVSVAFHTRPWAGAFNVVMATTIMSIACLQDGLGTVSTVLLWLAAVAFVVLVAVDIALARHPIRLLGRAGRLDQGFHGLGFVADACVLGTRIVDSGPAARDVSAALLAVGGLLWLVIGATVVIRHRGARVAEAHGEWLLTVVATEGLAILASRLGSADDLAWLRTLGTVLWGLGGVLYVAFAAALAERVLRGPFGAADLTPDWWIVMGAAAIFALGAASATDGTGGSPGGVLGLGAWCVATAWIPVLAGAEWWRARRLGRPRFSPERWSMVFPLGMYSASGQALGRALPGGALVQIGRWWLPVALAVWVAVAAGELRHALTVRVSDIAAR